MKSALSYLIAVLASFSITSSSYAQLGDVSSIVPLEDTLVGTVLEVYPSSMDCGILATASICYVKVGDETFEIYDLCSQLELSEGQIVQIFPSSKPDFSVALPIDVALITYSKSYWGTIIEIPVSNEVVAEVNPLWVIEYDEIKAYTINFDLPKSQKMHVQMYSEAEKYSLDPYYVADQKVVPDSLHENIINLFSATETYGDDYADCFEPRFLLQFNMKGKEVQRIVICEGCRHLISSSPIPAVYENYRDLVIEEEGETMIYRRYEKGFSEIGAEQINALCRSLNMAYCKD